MLLFLIFLALRFDIANSSAQHGIYQVEFHQQYADKKAPAPQQSKKQLPAIPSSCTETPATNTEKQHSYNAEEDTTYRIYLWATILGVAVALVTLGFIIRSANAAKESAQAAKQNAQYLMNAERAWVDGELTKELPDSNPGWDEISTSDYALKVTNHGRTPAFIIDWNIGMGVFPVHERVRPENITSRFSRPLNFLLLPNETKFVDKFDMAEYFKEEWGNVLVASKAAVVDVIIRYSDVISGLGKQASGSTHFTYSYRVHKLKFDRIDTLTDFT